MYKDYYTADDEWLGADGVQGGRAVELFRQGQYSELKSPELVQPFECPFSDACQAATKVESCLDFWTHDSCVF